jgi:hypothetical protein
MPEKPIDPKKLISDALNEHGFLLQQVIRKRLEGPVEGSPDPLEKWEDKWRFLAAEYPVTAADGSQTRIDLLLQHHCFTGMYVCMECKRPNPKFKKWVFFDRESSVAGMQDWQINLETLTFNEGPAARHQVRRSLDRFTTMRHVTIFSYYLEAGLKRDGSASSTETIEKAFYQLMKAHSGLMAKFESSNDRGSFRSIPVLVTTAELVEAKFDPKRVSIQTGMIDAADLDLASLDYCAVNYRADDNLALKPLNPQKLGVGLHDLINAQIRTVFVVKATALHKFLNWASTHLTNPS